MVQPAVPTYAAILKRPASQIPAPVVPLDEWVKQRAVSWVEDSVEFFPKFPSKETSEAEPSTQSLADQATPQFSDKKAFLTMKEFEIALEQYKNRLTISEASTVSRQSTRGDSNDEFLRKSRFLEEGGPPLRRWRFRLSSSGKMVPQEVMDGSSDSSASYLDARKAHRYSREDIIFCPARGPETELPSQLDSTTPAYSFNMGLAPCSNHGTEARAAEATKSAEYHEYAYENSLTSTTEIANYSSAGERRDPEEKTQKRSHTVAPVHIMGQGDRNEYPDENFIMTRSPMRPLTSEDYQFLPTPPRSENGLDLDKLRVVATEQYRNYSGVLWDIITRYLQPYYLHPANMTEQEFVELVCSQEHERPAWIQQNIQAIKGREMEKHMSSHYRLRDAGISPAWMDMVLFEFMTEAEQMYFIGECQNVAQYMDANRVIVEKMKEYKIVWPTTFLLFQQQVVEFVKLVGNCIQPVCGAALKASLEDKPVPSSDGLEYWNILIFAIGRQLYETKAAPSDYLTSNPSSSNMDHNLGPNKHKLDLESSFEPNTNTLEKQAQSYVSPNISQTEPAMSRIESANSDKGKGKEKLAIPNYCNKLRDECLGSPSSSQPKLEKITHHPSATKELLKSLDHRAKSSGSTESGAGSTSTNTTYQSAVFSQNGDKDSVSASGSGESHRSANVSDETEIIKQHPLIDFINEVEEALPKSHWSSSSESEQDSDEESSYSGKSTKGIFTRSDKGTSESSLKREFNDCVPIPVPHVPSEHITIPTPENPASDTPIDSDFTGTPDSTLPRLYRCKVPNNTPFNSISSPFKHTEFQDRPNKTHSTTQSRVSLNTNPIPPPPYTHSPSCSKTSRISLLESPRTIRSKSSKRSIGSVSSWGIFEKRLGEKNEGKGGVEKWGSVKRSLGKIWESVGRKGMGSVGKRGSLKGIFGSGKRVGEKKRGSIKDLF